MAEKLTNVCSICKGIFDRPKLLPCSHTFCQECLEQLVRIKHINDRSFPCPMCREKIIIPEGGVKNFKTNFYIPDQCEDNTANCENKCMDHNITTDVFCKTCSMCICSKCYMKNHFGHKYLDLSSEELKKTTQEKINVLKKYIKSQLDEYIQTSNNFAITMSELSNTASSICHRIDIQLAKICSNVTQSAVELKKKVNDWLKKEHEKLQLEKHEIDTKKQVAESQCKQLDDNLEKPLIDIWPNLLTLKQEIMKFRDEPKVQYLPVVRSSKFMEGEINVVNLINQLGHFNIQEPPKESALELVEGQVYNVTTVFNIKDVKASVIDMSYIKCQDSPWQVGVCYNSSYTTKVLCDIKPCADYRKHIKRITGNITCKLLNLVDHPRSIEETKSVVILYNGLRYYVYLPIDYKTLTDPTNGFIDSNGDFKIQTIIKITELVPNN